MALIEFKDLPDTTTPLNASNLNNNFNELDTKIDNIIEPSSYTLTNTPAHSIGTNDISIKKFGKIVIVNFQIWTNTITADTWTDIGTLPSSIVPTNNLYGTGIVISGGTGNIIGEFMLSINNGVFRIKSNVSLGTTAGLRANAIYVL